MGTQPESPLLPQHHEKKSKYADAATIVVPTATDPPTPPAASDALNNKKPQSELAECLTGCCVVAIFFALVGGVITTAFMTYGHLAPYSPSADVVSAFVSVNNDTNGPKTGRLTANWAFTLNLNNALFCDYCQGVYPYQVEASVYYHGGEDGGGHMLASTHQFSGLTVDPSLETFLIQLGAEEADVGESVVAAIFKDVAELEQNRLRFRAVVLVWVRVKPNNLRSRYYLVRISCDPFWTGSAGIVGKSHEDRKKCQVHVTRQSKPSTLDEDRTRLSTAK
ncbi:unnamed protein product [Linum tenue]|uniref:Late embryogenesis abundant protein LEA-2 subgroup domain-containing protein n=1 Tax=Linum tenue TaxID=586396 RepID=A0AAV0HS90_9ROSI|nr:unnamed protein product [Linum tenue]CAI0388359.1 unnamed protein product [Linum tenue]